MGHSDTVDGLADRLAHLIEERLGVRGRGLDAKLRRAGRALPKWLQRDARRIVDAQRLQAHPKLAMMTDTAELSQVAKACEGWLKSVDPSERRKDRVLRFLGLNVLNLVLVAIAFVCYLVWAGHA